MKFDREVARRGLLDALPLYVPAIPFAFVIGLAITESGIPPLVGWSSSWLIFGGAAQLTLISLIGAGTAVSAAIVAALVVNARHLMYSAGLAPTFQRQPAWFRWLGPYVLIDQMFALMSVHLDDDPDQFRTYYLAAGFTFWSLWQITTAIGLAIGPIVPLGWDIEFAVPILFIGLLVLGIDRWPKLAAAIVGAGVTYLCASIPNRGGLLVGAVAGVLAGVLVNRYQQ
jgi:branched chain amino acid efflux pump